MISRAARRATSHGRTLGGAPGGWAWVTSLWPQPGQAARRGLAEPRLLVAAGRLHRHRVLDQGHQRGLGRLAVARVTRDDRHRRRDRECLADVVGTVRELPV